MFSFHGIFTWTMCDHIGDGCEVYYSTKILQDIGDFEEGEVFDNIFWDSKTLTLEFFRKEHMVLRTRMKFVLEVI